jgi:hypothetical protein
MSKQHVGWMATRRACCNRSDSGDRYGSGHDGEKEPFVVYIDREYFASENGQGHLADIEAY